MLKKLVKALRSLLGQCFSGEPSSTTTGDQTAGYHGVSSSTVGVSALAQHLYHFEITSQVPEGLSRHVTLSKKAQSNWYRKLSKAWRESKPPPSTSEEASRLVILTLQKRKQADVEGLLSFYGLPVISLLYELTTTESPQADGIKFKLHTLPVDGKTVPDGDGVNVYVSASDAHESSQLPHEVSIAVDERKKARAVRNYSRADALQKQINNAGYRVLNIDDEEILARRYRIRLRGIDAPENAQPYGKEAKDELVKIVNGKCLTILVFDEDQYGRFVGDVYCDRTFVQKEFSLLLNTWASIRKGLAWHYTFYDKRPEFQQWEKEAKAKRIGLWALSDPEKPWEWRRKNPQHRY